MDSFLLGPFEQIVTMDHLPEGPLKDDQLEIKSQSGILIKNGLIEAIDSFNVLKKVKAKHLEVSAPSIAIPGLIDAHTHLCFSGTRSSDYAKRLGGAGYQQIAAEGGGILDTVKKTRAASKQQLVDSMLNRCARLWELGITTCEVKSGYGLNVTDEIKMLEAIHEAGERQAVDLIPTCLGAHIIPPEFDSPVEYLEFVLNDLLLHVKLNLLTQRVDIFVEKGAFSVEVARSFLQKAKLMGFSLCIHGDQFSRGGAQLACEVGALSCDHLEVSTEEDAKALQQHQVIPIVLPGCSFGLGLPFPPARLLLDQGLPLVIASDWNPGSAPMGHLLLQAAVLGAAQHLSMAETLAAITVRAAKALELPQRGILRAGLEADIAVFPCEMFQEILYNQGMLFPSHVYSHRSLGNPRNPKKGLFSS